MVVVTYRKLIGSHPQYRQQGRARRLYSHLVAAVKHHGYHEVLAVTSPINRDSVAFHLKMGFLLKTRDGVVDGIPVISDYDGLGNSRVWFTYRLAALPR